MFLHHPISPSPPLKRWQRATDQLILRRKRIALSCFLAAALDDEVRGKVNIQARVGGVEGEG